MHQRCGPSISKAAKILTNIHAQIFKEFYDFLCRSILLSQFKNGINQHGGFDITIGCAN